MTANVQALLQPLKDRLAAATEGPWEPMRAGMLGTRVVRVDGEWEGIIPPEFIKFVTPAMRSYDNAVFIAAAPTDQAKLIAAIEGVLELHQSEHKNLIGPYCTECVSPIDGGAELYPCNTVRALTQALGGDTA